MVISCEYAFGYRRLVSLLAVLIANVLVGACASDAANSIDIESAGSDRPDIRYDDPNGILDFLDTFVMNVPASDVSFRRGGFQERWPSPEEFEAATDEEYAVLALTVGVLYESLSIIDEMPELSVTQELHRYFVSAFEECQEGLRWPDIRLFAEYVDRITWADTEQTLEYVRDHDLSYAEYLAVRSQCAHSAATYPGIDVSYRDELLRPQRQYFVERILMYLNSGQHPMIVLVDPDDGVFGDWSVVSTPPELSSSVRKG